MRQWTQWDYVQKNLGEWQGSFTRLSPLGEEIEDTPSLITLTGFNENRSIHLVLTRYYPDTDGILQPQEIAFDFSDPSPGAMFFETGAFSEGSPYFRSGGSGGSEFAFRHEDRRLRLIQQFNSGGELFRFTLVREQRVGSNASERPPLDLAGWLGVWQGEAVTLYPGSMQIDRMAITQTAENICDRSVKLTQTIGTQVTESIWTIVPESVPTRLTNQSIQVILLPDGAYAMCPTRIESGVTTSLEVGWSIAPNLRQRLIRNYTDRGEWFSLTFITESK
jgi:Domain of unknown function (DUF3598)